jgi:hypothetical protein
MGAAVRPEVGLCPEHRAVACRLGGPPLPDPAELSKGRFRKLNHVVCSRRELLQSRRSLRAPQRTRPAGETVLATHSAVRRCTRVAYSTWKHQELRARKEVSEAALHRKNQHKSASWIGDPGIEATGGDLQRVLGPFQGAVPVAPHAGPETQLQMNVGHEAPVAGRADPANDLSAPNERARGHQRFSKMAVESEAGEGSMLEENPDSAPLGVDIDVHDFTIGRGEDRGASGPPEVHPGVSGQARLLVGAHEGAIGGENPRARGASGNRQRYQDRAAKPHRGGRGTYRQVSRERIRGTRPAGIAGREEIEKRFGNTSSRVR